MALIKALADLFKIGEGCPIRDLSDDYDWSERGIPTGESYTVRVGEASFNFVFGCGRSRYDLSNIRVFVDRIYVLNFTDQIEWKQQSPALSEQILKDAQELLARHRKKLADRAQRDRQREAVEAKELSNFQNKWGVNDAADEILTRHSKGTSA